MFNALTKAFTNLTKKFLPDAFVFAIILTVFIFFCGIILQNKSPFEMIIYWGDGFWNLMTFSMQMVLVLVTGFTLAKTEMVSHLLRSVAKLADSNTSAVMVVTIVSIVSCYLNWGFGLIVSALLAVEVAKQVKLVNFGLLLASAYSGFIVWHAGLSGSIPLKLTSPSSNIKKIIDVESISLSETIFSYQNFILLFFTILIILCVNYYLSKNTDLIKQIEVDSFLDSVSNNLNQTDHNMAQKIEQSRILLVITGLFGFIYILNHFIQGKGLNLNIMIFIFLISSLIFTKNPKMYLKNFQSSVKDSSGIILQFPFYAGMMGMMSSSGLAQSLSEFFISISNESTFLFFTYISAGIVNFFVPSGGGQWAIQGPIILPAAKELGIDLAHASMAIAWGDAWSNMVQPFWALPLLSIGNISLGEMMSYCVMVFIATGIVASCVFLLI